MEEVEYKKNFEKIKQFQIEQEKQKMRGLNDYNMVNVVRDAFHEVGMHSNVIYSLINPNGLHYQNDLFLNLFIKKVLGFSLDEFGEIFSVNMEEQTDKKRRIDFTIRSKNYFIGIEMKINAGDSNRQIFDYYTYLKQEAGKQNVTMYYLTKEGKNASESSTNGVTITRISFQEHILFWLDACQKEVKNITNLNVAIEDYRNIVKKITNQYKGNIMGLDDYIKKDESIYKMAMEIQDTLPIIRKNIIDDFFERIINLLKDKLGIDWTVKLKGKSFPNGNFPLRIYKESWINNKQNNLIFEFNFNDKNYCIGTFGVLGMKDTVDIKNDILKKFEEKLNNLKELDDGIDDDEDFLHWEYLPNIDGVDDLVQYIMFNEDAEEEFIKEIIELIDIFESKSKLMTEINNYLNSKEELV